MGITPLTNEQFARRYRLKLNKDTFAFIEEYEEADAEIGPVITHAVWNGEAPLWFYILKEAELGKVPVQQMGSDGKPLMGLDGKPVLAQRGGARLGPVGGRIVTESLVGMLQRDRNSYLYLNASWKPTTPIAPATGQFTIVDLLKYAGVWS
jgi:hypothetical protein